MFTMIKAEVRIMLISLALKEGYCKTDSASRAAADVLLQSLALEGATVRS